MEEVGVVQKITQSMLRKLRYYRALVHTESPRFIRILDPRFRTSTLTDGNILRSFVSLPQPQQSVEVADFVAHMQRVTGEILDENSLVMVSNYEVIKILQATTSLDKGVRPLRLWKGNGPRSPLITAAVRKYLVVQSSSVASESAFSVSGKLFDAERTRLSDESNSAWICVRAWKHLLDSLRSKLERP